MALTSQSVLFYLKLGIIPQSSGMHGPRRVCLELIAECEVHGVACDMDMAARFLVDDADIAGGEAHPAVKHFRGTCVVPRSNRLSLTVYIV